MLFLGDQSEWKFRVLIGFGASRSLIDGDGADQEDVQEASSMGVSISLSTYRLQYEAGTEDVLWRVRRSEEEELFARAQARSAERIRSRWLK